MRGDVATPARSNEDKRRAVLTLLNDAEWSAWSNREIGRRCPVDDKTVAKLRETLTAEIRSDSRIYTTKHGTVAVMNTAAIGKPRGAETLECAIRPKGRHYSCEIRYSQRVEKQNPGCEMAAEKCVRGFDFDFCAVSFQCMLYHGFVGRAR